MLEMGWLVPVSLRSKVTSNLTSFTISPEVIDAIPTDTFLPVTLNADEEIEKFVA